MTKKNIVAVIPARYASTRFPAKPLAKINGKTMVEHVWIQAKKVFENVYVATDNQEIFNTVQNFGGNPIMTPPELPSGTDRVANAVEKLQQKPDIIINIQGDEPFIATKQLQQIEKLLQDPKCDIATLIYPINTQEELQNPNCVKTIITQDKYAIYFSRQPIPYIREVDAKNWTEKHQYFKHIGLYGYKYSALKQITKLKPSPLEQAESLEQLRWIENNLKIKTDITTIKSFGIDTPQDLEKLLEQKKNGKFFAL